MKNQIMILAMCAAALMASCAKKSDGDAGTPVTPTISDTTPDDAGSSPSAPVSVAPDHSDHLYEREADFTPASIDVFQDYVVSRPLNNPERFRITVNVQEMFNDTIGGQVRLTYYDNGAKYEGVFESGDREEDTQKNYWFDYGSDEVFIGYFSDRYGAIILVIDEVIDLGDGGGDEVLAGKVYFMNYEPSRAPMSPTKCWNIEYGPYACGASFDGIKPTDIINHDYPGRNYQLLGTFKGLSRAKAFNVDFTP